MNNFLKTAKGLIALKLFVLSAGCAAGSLSPNAAKVTMSIDKAPVDCEQIGEVYGEQGGIWTGYFTSSDNLITGAANDLRKAAVELGANYVTLNPVIK